MGYRGKQKINYGSVKKLSSGHVPKQGKDAVMILHLKKSVDGLSRNSEELTAAFKGKRRMYIGKAGYRLIYSVCKECRGKGYGKNNSCLDCNSKDDDAVVFFDIIHRSNAYDNY